MNGPNARKLSPGEEEKRDHEIARLVDLGYTYQAIGDRFGISKRTVWKIMKERRQRGEHG